MQYLILVLPDTCAFRFPALVNLDIRKYLAFIKCATSLWLSSSLIAKSFTSVLAWSATMYCILYRSIWPWKCKNELLRHFKVASKKVLLLEKYWHFFPHPLIQSHATENLRHGTESPSHLDLIFTFCCSVDNSLFLMEALSKS